MDLPKGSLISFFSTLAKQYGGINLSQGIPGYMPPIGLLDTLKEIAHNEVHQYPPGIGNFDLRKNILSYYFTDKEILDNNLLITQGATEAICLIFMLMLKKYGKDFSTLSFAPAYESYMQLPKQFGTTFYEIEIQQNKLPIDQIIEYIDNKNVKLIFLASPGNPLGISFSKEDIDILVDVCSQKKCVLVFDAAYSMLYFSHKPYIPLEKLNPYLFIVNSFSKWYSITGWRVGFMFYDFSLNEELRTMHDYTGLCSNSVLQAALAKFISIYNFDEEYSVNLRNNLGINFTHCYNFFGELGFDCSEAIGGYFLWAKLPDKYKCGFEFAYNLFEQKKVAIVPGIHFSDYAERYIRINISRPIAELNKGLEKIMEFMKQ